MRRTLWIMTLGLLGLALPIVVGQDPPDPEEPVPFTLRLSRQGTATIAAPCFRAALTTSAIILSVTNGRTAS